MKYICLDIGNVLCHVDMVEFLELASTTFNITEAEAVRFLKRFQRIHDLGYTTMKDELMDQFKLKSEATTRKLVHAWNEAVQPNLDIITKLNELKVSHNLQVALLSNIGPEHAMMMEDRLKHGGFFEGAIKHFSCFVGARKPSMVYYQSFLMQYPQFKGCLYVDDLQENLDASEQFGFKTLRLSLEESGILDSKILEIESLIVKTP
jgi:FMN phosphatase YigB (HAD superfamily)